MRRNCCYALQRWSPRSIENLQALYITSSGATLKAEYKFENGWSDAKIRFEYKKKNTRPFPTWTEVLEVIKALGYRKVAEPQISPQPEQEEEQTQAAE
jgi:hypothetical protein